MWTPPKFQLRLRSPPQLAERANRPGRVQRRSTLTLTLRLSPRVWKPASLILEAGAGRAAGHPPGDVALRASQVQPGTPAGEAGTRGVVLHVAGIGSLVVAGRGPLRPLDGQGVAPDVRAGERSVKGKPVAAEAMGEVEAAGVGGAAQEAQIGVAQVPVHGGHHRAELRGAAAQVALHPADGVVGERFDLFAEAGALRIDRGELPLGDGFEDADGPAGAGAAREFRRAEDGAVLRLVDVALMVVGVAARRLADAP